VTIKKYKATRYSGVELKHFVRETEKFLVSENGRRDAKSSEYTCYFDTFEQAKNHFMNMVDTEIRSHESVIQRLKSDKQRCSNMKEPK